MWLVYPVLSDDVQNARRGIMILLSASAIWYVSLAVALAVWSQDLLYKVHGKFVTLPDRDMNWIPFLFLISMFTFTGGLRALGYRFSRNIAGAVSTPESITIATYGVFIYLGAVGTIYFGFSGLIAIAAALGGALELLFLRYPRSLFGMVISPIAVKRVGYYSYARFVWLVLIVIASFVMLLANGLTSIPRADDGPYDQSIVRVNGILHLVFKALSAIVILALPALTVAYWLILYNIYMTVNRLTDPKGPVVQPESPVKPGFDQLKQVLQTPTW